jgi:hypothetical protein
MTTIKSHIWYKIQKTKALPICSEKEDYDYINELDSNNRIIKIDVQDANNRLLLKLFGPCLVDSYWGDIKWLIITKKKLKQIDSFINETKLTSQRKLIFLILAILNDETATFLNLITSVELSKEFENREKDTAPLKEVIARYEKRYINKGKNEVNRDELISISFKFLHPTKTIKITNFFILLYIMNAIRDLDISELSVSVNFERQKQAFKYKTATNLLDFFTNGNVEWKTKSKAQAHLIIHKMFELADIEPDDSKTDKMKQDLIKKWIARTSSE